MILHATWTPLSCYVKKKINIHELDDFGVKLQARLSTFESGGRDVKVVNRLSKKIREKIRQTCEDIVGHVVDITHKKTMITNLELIFKVDHNEQLWLLYCLRVKVKESNNTLNSMNGSEGHSIVKSTNKSMSMIGGGRRNREFREGLIASFRKKKKKD